VGVIQLAKDPAAESVQCTVQGFFGGMFRASLIFWMAAIALTLYVWGASAALAFLPLIYGWAEGVTVMQPSGIGCWLGPSYTALVMV
jgi:hypothetical protein